ncbi:hypothetical protein OAV62_02150 [bacterium]|nr:hypothetical protein [bacterium]
MIANTDLIEFLQGRIELIKSGTYTFNEFLPILSFYVEQHLLTDDDDKLNMSMTELRQYAMLGITLQHLLEIPSDGDVKKSI